MPSRRMARELALQALFSVEVGHRDPAEVLDEYFATFSESAHRLFVKDLVLGTLEHHEESDERITPLLEGWTIERLPTIDRLLLRMGRSNCGTTRKRRVPSSSTRRSNWRSGFRPKHSGRFVNGVLSALTERKRPCVSFCASLLVRSLLIVLFAAGSVAGHRRGVLAQLARHQPHGRLPAGAFDAHLCARRLAAGDSVQREPHLGADRQDSADRARCVHRQRRSQFLPASRRGFRRHHARRRFGLHASSRRTGRIDDHAAARARPVSSPIKQTISRKVQEALLAMEIERYYTKDEILERYLNLIYLGLGSVRRRCRGAHVLRRAASRN